MGKLVSLAAVSKFFSFFRLAFYVSRRLLDTNSIKVGIESSLSTGSTGGTRDVPDLRSAGAGVMTAYCSIQKGLGESVERE